MDAEKLVVTSGILLVGGYILVELADAVIKVNPDVIPITTAILGAFTITAAMLIRRRR